MLSTIYSLLCVMLPCTIYQLVIIKKDKNKNDLFSHFIKVYFFLFYIYLVLSVVGIGSVWDIGHYDTLIRLEEINFLPFQSEGLFTYVLNVIMFMPLGFLLPLIWEKYRNSLKVLFIGFGFSLSIELGQLFNRRNTDIDDLLMNTLGAIIGYYIWSFLKSRFNKINKNATMLSQHEPLIYLGLAISGKFLLYNWRLFII